ncbi:hypothetical protein FHR24_002017 [Wenyingzhuangia heitensis]|uniref:Zinc-ribbon domain-containing protein n=1 Tax=Wenyingzhuangia heitensis TaxID=1487859 RepID=A0ABX0UB16_9FLAO|nr:putative zinc-binding metallopeptidase [Wenyingzhuangia heitensis]NIJ45549.1 hypothetical protein [Wenyingzhuangia heitensis]
MKTFNCPNCQNPIFFENTQCEKCFTHVSYNPMTESFEANEQLQPNDLCKNQSLNICNWSVAGSHQENFCLACSLNREVPNPKDLNGFDKWENLEPAKHRLIYQLLKLKLPIFSKLEKENGIAFDFLSENNKQKAVTGHANGVITILLSEADSVHREVLRKQMNEPYRTLLGHFRHEVGHYYWDLLFDENNIDKCRAIFGDERINYGEALQNHYKNGAPTKWNENYISEYASSHPWEDWAESWAHYLHLMDTLETANAFGVSFKLKKYPLKNLTKAICPNPYETTSFKTIFDSSVALTCMANSLNRAMGLSDIYPFVIPKAVYKKLNFIHNVLSNYSSIS